MAGQWDLRRRVEIMLNASNSMSTTANELDQKIEGQAWELKIAWHMTVNGSTRRNVRQRASKTRGTL